MKSAEAGNNRGSGNHAPERACYAGGMPKASRTVRPRKPEFPRVPLEASPPGLHRRVARQPGRGDSCPPRNRHTSRNWRSTRLGQVCHRGGRAKRLSGTVRCASERAFYREGNSHSSHFGTDATIWRTSGGTGAVPRFADPHSSATTRRNREKSSEILICRSGNTRNVYQNFRNSQRWTICYTAASVLRHNQVCHRNFFHHGGRFPFFPFWHGCDSLSHRRREPQIRVRQLGRDSAPLTRAASIMKEKSSENPRHRRWNVCHLRAGRPMSPGQRPANVFRRDSTPLFHRGWDGGPVLQPRAR